MYIVLKSIVSWPELAIICIIDVVTVMDLNHSKVRLDPQVCPSMWIDVMGPDHASVNPDRKGWQ